MDSHAKQKATHDVHTKFRDFYPGVLVKDLRKEDTSVARLSSGKKWTKVWKRHIDHVRRDSMDRAVSVQTIERESRDHPSEVAQAVQLGVRSPD